MDDSFGNFFFIFFPLSRTKIEFMGDKIERGRQTAADESVRSRGVSISVNPENKSLSYRTAADVR